MMKPLVRSFCLIMLIAGLFACKQSLQSETPQIISGTITNGEVDTLTIYQVGGVNVKLPVDSGRFSDTLDLEAGYYQIRIGRESTAMYWDSAFQINLIVDLEEFDESISYEGYGAEENNHLAKTYLIKEQKAGTDLILLKEDEFLDSLNRVRSELLRSSDNLSSTSFVKEQKEDADYFFNEMIYNYENIHAYLSKKDSFEVTSTFYDQLLPIDMDKGAAYQRSEQYRSLLRAYIQFKNTELYNEGIEGIEAIKVILENFNSQKVKSGIVDLFSYSLLNPSSELDEAYALMQSVVEDSVKMRGYTEAYETLKKVMPGYPSPQFISYENHSGGTTSLSDLKGKYVYIDVWATWCGPCIREIPSLQAIEEDFEDKPIHFVSISVDNKNDHETWVRMVNDKDLGGIQLFADESWSSDFVKDYYIRGIPRFILLDPEGIIIDSDAKRPSNPELRKQLNELLNKAAEEAS